MENLKDKSLIDISIKNDTQVKKYEPKYSKGEEIFNVISHFIGAPLGVIIIVFGVMQSLSIGMPIGVLASIVYGVCMIITYSISGVYHLLKPSKGKRVLRIIDHCTVYLLILGTYTGLLLTGIIKYNPTVAIVMLAIEWSVGVLAITLTAINMKKYTVFSMICYVGLGWGIIAVSGIVIGAISFAGYMWLLSGGVAYTIGSVLYALGRKHKYMHSIFHIFCIVGSVLQFICFMFYCL